MIYLVIDDVLFVKMFKIIRVRELTNEIWTDTNRVTDTSSSTLPVSCTVQHKLLCDHLHPVQTSICLYVFICTPQYQLKTQSFQPSNYVRRLTWPIVNPVLYYDNIPRAFLLPIISIGLIRSILGVFSLK